MKNKLWVFGDSFSFNYKIKLENSWPHILSSKLNMDLNLLSNPGASNFQIYLKVLDNIKFFSEKDLIIISTSWNDRYFIPLYSHGMNLEEILFNVKSNQSINLLDKYYIDNFDYDKNYFFNKNLFINLFSILYKLNIHFFYWNLMNFNIGYEKNLIRTKKDSIEFFYDWFNDDSSMWLENGTGDKHLGLNGSEVLANHFYENIIYER